MPRSLPPDHATWLTVLQQSIRSPKSYDARQIDQSPRPLETLRRHLDRLPDQTPIIYPHPSCSVVV